MPSASAAEKSAVAPDLKCFGCGNPIIKDGQFKCLRCKPKRNVPATLGKRDIVCPRHRQAVVLMRYDRASGQYRAYCQKSGCPSHDGKTGTEISQAEETMTQAAVEQKENPAIVSKTQELRDWLDGEIRTTIKECLTLAGAINWPTTSREDDILSLMGSTFRELINDLGIAPGTFVIEGGKRYAGLTPREREAKMAEDRRKLEELKKRLEQLKSARELDVDVDGIEKCLEVEVEIHNIGGPRLYFLVKGRPVLTSVSFSLPAPRTLSITQYVKGDNTNRHIGNFEFSGVKDCKPEFGYRLFDERKGRGRVIFELEHGVVDINYDGYISYQHS